MSRRWGKLSSKDSLLGAIRDGIVHFDKVDAKGSRIVDLSGAGMIQGAIEMQLKYGQEQPSEVGGLFAVTAVFTLRDNEWKLIGASMTQVKPKQHCTGKLTSGVNSRKAPPR